MSKEIVENSLNQKIRLVYQEGKSVRCNLPMEGYINIDRRLPFLIVYRYPTKRPDPGTENLVKGEASFIIASGHKRFKSELTSLIYQIVESAREFFEAFLIIELWSNPEKVTTNNDEETITKPGFRIITSSFRPPTKSVEALANSLKGITILKQKSKVDVLYDLKRAPQGMSPLLPSHSARKLKCYVIGLMIEPVYQNININETFPLVLRRLHRGLSRSLKRSVFQFSKYQTSYDYANYQSLGKRALVKSVWEVDKKIADLSNSFDFLLQVTPVNTQKAWLKFRKSKYEKVPTLYYRPLPIDPDIVKQQLFKIPIERIEDPTLESLFRGKRKELDLQLSMLSDRGTQNFLYGSLILYGSVLNSLKNLALKVLKKLPPRNRDEIKKNSISAKEFAKHVELENKYYNDIDPNFSSQVFIRDDISGLITSKGNLLIGKDTRIPISRVQALLQHEIGTHVLTYHNGKSQPFRQLYCGLAGYDELQEGLAVLSEYFVDGMSSHRLRILAARVMAGHYLLDGASFIDTYRKLNCDFGFSSNIAFNITVRVFRAGGLTKDIVYLRGLLDMLAYLKQGGDLEILFTGKIASKHVSIIQELKHRKVLHPSPLVPRYMLNVNLPKKLEDLKSGISLFNLINRRDK